MPFSQEKAFELVTSAHERERLAHAFLITGPRGSGKERLAAQMADLLNGEADDGGADLWGEPVAKEIPTLDEVEGEFTRVVRPRSKSRQIRVDEMRDIEKMMNQSAPSGKWKIGVIVDADRMNESAENAFLKTLEEPPQQSLLLLLSSEPERLLPTIWSRCVHLALTKPADAAREEEVTRLLTVLDEVTRQGLGTLDAGLLVKAGLETLLQEHKEVIAKRNAAAFKEESAIYKNASEGDWLERREKMYEAQTAAEYHGARSRIIDTLLSWVGDLVRAKAGGIGLEFPEYRETLLSAAENEHLDGLLRRVGAVEELRRLSETNVVEALSLEVCLMKAFGKT